VRGDQLEEALVTQTRTLQATFLTQFFNNNKFHSFISK